VKDNDLIFEAYLKEGETPMLWTLISVGGMHSEVTTVIREFGAMTDEEAYYLANKIRVQEEIQDSVEWEDYRDTGMNPHEIDVPGAVGEFSIGVDGLSLVKHRG
jgi:hypothetical protein